MSYQHLAEHERYQIFILKQAGIAIDEIARQLSRHRSTIYRELKRNLVPDHRVKDYSPSRAHTLAHNRKLIRAHRRRISRATWDDIEAKLRCRLSPEQISGQHRLQGLPRVSHEMIYRHIWKDKQAGGDLWRFLRGKLRRGRRYRRNRQRGQIVGRVGIEHRSPVVEARRRRGDWEIDTVFGQRGRSALVTLVDRRTRFIVIEKVSSKHASGVAEAVIRGLSKLQRRVHTITSDNGKEFALHQLIAQALNAKFYFARPYASWERGTNENSNGLLRQYFPKKHDFNLITQNQIDFAAREMNDRPRKTLGFRTPNELFFA